MRAVAIVPTELELKELVQAFRGQGHAIEPAHDARLAMWKVPALDLFLAPGGLGKAQFAVQTQYLLDRGPWALAICAGAAGALADDVAIGDAVVATETIEHDIRKVSRPLVPRFKGDEATLARLRAAPNLAGTFRVHFGGIASGDEDVVDEQRRRACQQATGALAVAWEGAGGARACAFSGVPFVEVRGIADRADASGPRDFRRNLGKAMQNVATVLAVAAGRTCSARQGECG